MTVLLLGVCSATSMLFVARARLGARVRSLAGVRLRATAVIAGRAGRLPLRRALAATVVGYVAGGRTFALIAGGAALCSEPMLRARARRAELAALDAQLPDVMRALSSALRAGRSLSQALSSAAEDAPMPVRASLHQGLARIEVGAPIDEALDRFAAAAATPSAAMAVETIRIGRDAGGDLPAVLDIAVDALIERERLVRDRRATTTQARMSGVLVGAMPLAFFVFAGSGARAQLSVLFGTPVGWVLLAAGMTMEIGGALWMRSLLRPA